MTERLQTTLMIAAILLASAFVTATTWAGLRLVSSLGDATAPRSATVTRPGPPIHADLIPVLIPPPAMQPVSPVPGYPWPAQPWPGHPR